MAPTACGKPTDQDLQDIAFRAGQKLAHPAPGDEIVITGLSGTYPNSLNVYDFRDNLLNKVDLVSGDDRRWDIKHPEIPERGGRLYEIEKFDAGFFGVHHKQAHTMDPMGRILLEKVFEAVVDAGLHPSELRGTRTGVFVGACFSEAEKTWFYEQIQPHGFGITGCIRAMLANRVSYWLGVDGPSYTVDTACSSSLYALEHAYRSIRMGHCETAIVGGCNVCLHPYVTLQFARLGVLNKDGKCKCFDESADGYTRSEAIIACVLQKSKNSRRIYSRIVHAKTNCDGYKEQGITYPSGIMQNKLLTEFYNECGVNPNSIDYVEAHGTGTKVGDPEEVGGIESIFCGETRKTPLMIGSVKSNIGHSEPASGLCSVTKVILAMEAGCLIPNINFNTPRKEMKALNEGRMQVVTEKIKWKGGYSAISSFGFGGANCHVLLKSNEKEKINNGIAKDNLPRLIYVSGRTEEAIGTIIDDLAGRPLDSEYIGLLHEVYKFDIPAHLYRGYAIMTKEKVVTRECDSFPYDDKPLWFVFSGLGSQWLGMGAKLMEVPTFAGTIQKCHQILSQKGINIIDLLTNTNAKTFSSVTNTLVGITTIQIGLVELLNAIDVKPTGFISHSIGEIAAAYYDGALTLEQALLSAVYLGQAVDSSKKAIGSMVSIEINQEQLKEFLIGVDVACQNDEKWFTLSGSTLKIQEVIKKLDASKQYKYKLIESSNIAYHSSLAEGIATLASKQLKALVQKPKERSDKWLSSSKMASKFCSAEFLSTVLSAPVLFEQSYESVPTNAVVLEVSPQGVLQEVLKRSVYDDCIIIPLLQENQDSTESFLSAIGKLYVSGHNPRIEKLYPAVEFPVSKSTPMLSPLIKWDHSQDWYVTKFEVQDKINSGERTITVKLNDEDQEYLSGHVIDGRTLYPATGYLQIVWETLGMVRGQLYSDLPVVFKDVKFHRATNVPKEGRVYLIVMVQKVSGNFEVIESGAAVVTGRVYVPDDIKSETINVPVPIPEKHKDYVPLKSRDIYKELRLRGYNYSGLFRGLHSCDTTATVGEVYWKDNWVSFMDTVLQMQILQEDTRGLFVPTAIRKLTIDSQKHKEMISNLNETGTLPVHVHRDIRTIVCGGVEIRGLEASAIGRKKVLGAPVLETYKFIPNAIETTLDKSLRIMLQLILENNNTFKVKTAENIEEDMPVDEDSLFSTEVLNVLADLPLIQADINVLTTKTIDIPGITVSERKLISETNCLMVIVSNALNRPQVLQAALNAISATGYVLARESLTSDLTQIDLTKIQIVLDHKLATERLVLLTKTTNTKFQNSVDLSEASDNKFGWLTKLQTIVKTDPNTILYSQGKPLNGIIGFTNCIRKEPGMDMIRCVFIMDDNAPKFDAKLPFYAEQLSKNITVNVLKNGVWGTYRHLLLDALKQIETDHAYVNVTVRGDLSSLKWIQDDLNKGSLKDHNRVLVHVYYSALNFRDIMTATGRIAPEFVAKGRFEQECVQGLEYSGRLEDGRRVFGMLSHKAMATKASADSQFMWNVPDEWSLEDAVTVPVVYGTVLYAFVVEGKIKPGMSILIHAGSGGVGQAAINIALYYGCTVYTTVGTQEKRDFIKKTWPQIKDHQIGNSRDCSFEQMINIQTNKRGVDLVLNSLAEEKLLASIRCLTHGGKFLEIGKFDLSKDNPLPLSMFKNENSFHGIMLDSFFSSASSVKQLLSELIASAIADGAVKPLKRHVFNENEIEEAFRFMATGKHMGKVLISTRAEETEKVIKPSKRLIKAVPRFIPTGTGCYIITGGLGGFGLEMVDWLILRGATKLVLTSRNGITTGYQAMRIKIWRSYGLDLVISTEDITTYDGCRNLINTAMKLGPVEGIFNLAVVLRDAIFENQTPELFEESFGPKAIATQYLDDLTRELCPKLRQFVIFSSVSCGRGNAGQTNYGMANSVMERICERRHADGFPALAVEWGAIGDVGLVAEMQEEHTEIVIGGTLQQRISSCLTVLDQFLLQSEPVVASMVVAEKRAGDGAAANIVDAVINILGIRDVKTVSIHSSLAELGMDSIMAVEIKQTLEREFEVFLSPQDIRSMTFARLQEIASERLANPAGEAALDAPAEIGDAGLQFMMRTVGSEEDSKKPFIISPSQNPKQKLDQVILIPGIEGMAGVLLTLANRITPEAIILQLGYDEDDTIKKMAQTIIKRTPEYFSSNNFNIIAYSYGCAIALEIASILESEGKQGRIMLIDGAPEMLRSMARQQIILSDLESDFENSVLGIIISIIVDAETLNYLKNIYEKLPTWDEKLAFVMAYGTKYSEHSESHLKMMCELVYLRLKAIVNYVPAIGKLKSSIKLFKPTQPSVSGVAEDFGLSEYTTQPIEIVYIEGNHVLIVESIDLANEINKDITGEETIVKDAFANKPELINTEAVRS